MFHPLPLSCMLPERMYECVKSQGKMSFHKTEAWGFIIKSGQTQRIISLRDTPKGDVPFFQTELLKEPFHFRQIYNSMYPPLFYGFPGGSVLRIHPPMQETGLIPGWGRSPGGGNGNPLQDSCLENPMDRGAWWAKTRFPYVFSWLGSSFSFDCWIIFHHYWTILAMLFQC